MAKPTTTATGPLIGAGSRHRTDWAHTKPGLPPALQGECLSVASDAGRVNVYVAGQGRPLLLIHSVNAAASAAEVRPLHDYFVRSRRVYSVDLPGFGLSQRSDRRYTPQMMTAALHAVVAIIRSRSQSNRFWQPCAGEPHRLQRKACTARPSGYDPRLLVAVPAAAPAGVGTGHLSVLDPTRHDPPLPARHLGVEPHR